MTAPSYYLSRWVFLRLLGVVYVVAFLSLSTQLLGLVGADGILPIGEYLDRAFDTFGRGAYWRFPTLVWISSHDLTLTAFCWLGALLAGILVIGVAPIPVLITLWVLYLSLTVAGQTFLGYQWDTLLLETGLLAVLYAPRGLHPTLTTEPPTPVLARWLIWWLLFRLMFLSGVTKITSGDPSWADWSALTFHYETQPLPLWSGWYLHQMPVWFHRLSAGGMFIVELLLPWAALTPPSWRRVRLVAATGLLLLQGAIGSTGNYGFFSLLTSALCLTLVDDRTWARILPYRLADSAQIVQRNDRPPSGWRARIGFLLCLVLFALGGLTFAREINTTLDRAGRSHLDVSWSDEIIRWVQPFRSVNGYGLFRGITVERPEILIEASADGATWVEWDLPWKPGDPRRAPRLVAPHQPRLDWQFWFAALDPQGAQYWLSSFMTQLLTGTPTVTGLMDVSPLGTTPPRYLRLAYYDYRFSTPSELAQDNAWWRRELIDYLTVPISLDAVSSR